MTKTSNAENSKALPLVAGNPKPVIVKLNLEEDTDKDLTEYAAWASKAGTGYVSKSAVVEEALRRLFEADKAWVAETLNF